MSYQITRQDAFRLFVGYVNYKVYATEAVAVEDINGRIRDVCINIAPEIFHNEFADFLLSETK